MPAQRSGAWISVVGRDDLGCALDLVVSVATGWRTDLSVHLLALILSILMEGRTQPSARSLIPVLSILA